MTAEERIEEYASWCLRDGMRRMGDAGLRKPTKRDCTAWERRMKSMLEAHAREAVEAEREVVCILKAACEKAVAAIKHHDSEDNLKGGWYDCGYDFYDEIAACEAALKRCNE